MVKDALDEAGLHIGQTQSSSELPFDEQLRRLHELHKDGIISEDEYQTKRKQILDTL